MQDAQHIAVQLRVFGGKQAVSLGVKAVVRIRPVSYTHLDVYKRQAQYELTLLDWAEAHKGARQYVAFANKCWPAVQTEFKFVPCYVNSRLAAMGIPVSCEVDIYGALSEYCLLYTSKYI